MLASCTSALAVSIAGCGVAKGTKRDGFLRFGAKDSVGNYRAWLRDAKTRTCQRDYGRNE